MPVSHTESCVLQSSYRDRIWEGFPLKWGFGVTTQLPTPWLGPINSCEVEESQPPLQFYPFFVCKPTFQAVSPFRLPEEFKPFEAPR